MSKRGKSSGKKTGKSGKPTRPIDPFALAFPMHLAESRMIEELRATVQKLRVFDSLGKTLTSSLELSEVLRIVVEKLGALVSCRHFGLVLLDIDSNEFYFEFPHELTEKKVSFPLGKGILGRCLERGKGGLFLDPIKDPSFDPGVDALVVSHPTSLITLPIMSRGTVLGLLSFYTEKSEQVFTDETQRTLETFSDYLAIAVENCRNYRAVQDLTVSDDLTKLYNARYLHLVLERELARSERYQEQFSIVFMDLDNFKSVNDQHGHMVGSQLLKEFGEFLLSMIRSSDVAIRYGGDEFVLVLPRTTKTESVQFLSRCRETLAGRRFLSSKHLNIKVTASFGVGTFPEDGKKYRRAYPRGGQRHVRGEKIDERRNLRGEGTNANYSGGKSPQESSKNLIFEKVLGNIESFNAHPSVGADNSIFGD